MEGLVHVPFMSALGVGESGLGSCDLNTHGCES
jgi:hypothetical protein